MVERTDEPVRYRVVYSTAARQALANFASRAKRTGRVAEFLAAIRQLDRLLHVYPQFGEPLIDLIEETGQIWRATVAPLFLRYAIFEVRRLVVVAAPPKLLPNVGF